MGKRSNFERKPRDTYDTPYEAVIPLLPHLKKMGEVYMEPCAGAGDLINHLGNHDHRCFLATDIEPRSVNVNQMDAFDISNHLGEKVITNPPWDRKILHPFIERFRHGWCWLLFDADWMHTKQAIPYMEHCKKIVSVGRVKWIPDSKMTGKDNCCWYLFGPKKYETTFYTKVLDN